MSFKNNLLSEKPISISVRFLSSKDNSWGVYIMLSYELFNADAMKYLIQKIQFHFTNVHIIMLCEEKRIVKRN